MSDVATPPRETMRIRVRVRRRPQPRGRPVHAMGNPEYRRAMLRGDLGPGTYRVGGRTLVTVPSRVLPWVRTPHGRLWHRVRWAQVLWVNPGSLGNLPRLCIQTWCGIATTRSRWGRRDPELADAPGGDVCTWCDTQPPDRRRLPDALAMQTTEEGARP